MAVSFPLLGGGSTPSVGLGTFTLFGKTGTDEQVTDAVKVAIDAGYRMFDSAYVYGTEAAVGRGIKAKIQDGTVKREDLFVITKLWNTHKNPAQVEDKVKMYLNNFQLDYVDLLLIHWPVQYADGDECLPRDENGKSLLSSHKIEDTWKAMEECVRKGLVQHLGLSNFNSRQLREILAVCTVKPVSMQVEVTPFFSNKRLVAYCQERGIVVTAFAPLGIPTRIGNTEADKNAFKEPVIIDIAKSKGKSPAQIILRYHIQNGLCVVPKSVTPSRIKENIQIFDFNLTEEEMQKIASLDTGERYFHVTQAGDELHPDYPFNEDY